MTTSLRSLVAFVIPAALLMTSVGCSTLSRGKCKSCESGMAYPAPSGYSDFQQGSGSAPIYSPSPIPVPPASIPPSEFQGSPVPPPPTGEAMRPNAIQRMQGSTTAFFLNANENVRRTFRR